MVGFSSIRSDNLVPGLDKGTFSQRIKKFVSSSSLPTLASNLEVHMPTVMQLNSPVPIPVMLRLVPDWNRSSESVTGLPPKVKLVAISIQILAMTDYIEPTFSGKQTTEDLKLEDALKALDKDIYIPCTDEWPPVNVGRLLGLRISRAGRVVQRQVHEIQREVLHPSFTTHNLHHTHVLRWKVQLDIAGEKYTKMDHNPLTILEPSDQGKERSWGETGSEGQERMEGEIEDGPPKEDTEDAPPPSFEQAVLEGAGR
ncbi:hypothetical protein ACJZ2D_011671 [Fusarium nematophilum]